MAKEIQAQSVTGATLYAIVLSPVGTVWNGSAFEAPLAANWGTYAVAMTEQSTTGLYEADFPTGITSANLYSIVAYKRAGGSPATTDPVAATGNRPWTGTTVPVPVVPDSTGKPTLAATQAFNNTGTWTGNLSGSVGSVTGNVGGSVATLTTLPTAPTDWLTSGSVSAGAVTKVQAGLATPTNITAGTITTVTTTTNLTNLPTIPTDWIAAVGVSSGAVTKIQTGLATPTNITAGTITTATNLTNLPAVPTDWLTAAGVKADAVTKIQSGLSTYAGTDTGGTATLLTRIPGTVQPQTGDSFARIGTAGLGLTAIGDSRLAYLDATVSSRSTYAGGDTSGTTTLLTRVTGAVALASQIPANFTTATFAGAGVFSVGALANAPTGGSAPTVPQIAAAILASPANLLATDGTGKVGVNNLPSDYQQRGVAVTLPTSAPTGYGGTGATPTQLAAAILATPTNLIATDVSGRVSLNLTQAVPTTNTAQTLGDALNAARAQGFGKWVLDSTGNTLTLYAGDGTTIVRTFTLQTSSNPTSRT